MEKLVIIANLGCVRPLVLQESGDDPKEKEHLIEMPDSRVEIKLEHLSEVVSDQSGRFTQSPSRGRGAGMSYGENHNLILERGKRALNEIASEIDKIVDAKGSLAWRLIAPQEILTNLELALSASARESLVKSEGADLTKLPIKELERRILG